MISGISRGSRPILRHHPQLRLDCSPAICPFSQRTVETPFCARKSAVLAPMIPPPTITTSARAGKRVIGTDGVDSRGHRLLCGPRASRPHAGQRPAVRPEHVSVPRSVDRGVHQVGHSVEPRRMSTGRAPRSS